MSTTIGVPIKLLHEAQGLIVTAELKTGQMYRGKLSNVEDTMNIQLSEVTCTGRDGQTTFMDQVMLRGSHIRFIQVPDNLRHAPMFENFSSREKKVKGLGLGKARAEVTRAAASNLIFPYACA
jgi:small nuclear ribonucleoprotein D3